MARFLAIYTGQPSAARPDDATIAKGMQAWTDWTAKHRDRIVEIGGPVAKTKRASKAGIADVSNAISAFTVVEAEDHAAAAKLFENHPHFAIFPGDGVDIMPILPIPTM